MYSFEPSEEQKMLMSTVNRYAINDLRPAAHEAEETGELPKTWLEKGWELGLLQASIPEVYGGFGDRSAVTGVLAAEELAFGDLAGALAVETPGLFALPVLLAGSEEQKKQYLPKIVAGAWHPYTSALIEYDFDFDAQDLKTTAQMQGHEFILNGEKAFVPFAQEAEVILVYAKLNGDTQAFIVSRNAPGLTVSTEREKLMSLNAVPMYRIKLDDVKVAAADTLDGGGEHGIETILASMRIAQAAHALGVARAAFEYSRDYAKEREAFGVKIAQKQAVAFMLAEMRTELEAMRLLTWEAAWKLDNSQDEAFTDAYLACVGAMDMVMMVTDRAVQVLGGHGYIRENPVEMWMRNGRGFAMLSGFAMV